MKWVKIPDRNNKADYDKALIRLVRVAMFHERLGQMIDDGADPVDLRREYRLPLITAKRIVAAWKDELGIEE